MAHMLSASGRGDILSSRSSQRGVHLNLLNTSRRERAVLDLTKTQVSSRLQTLSKRDEVKSAFGALLKPNTTNKNSLTSARRQNTTLKKLPLRTVSATQSFRKSTKVTGRTIVTPYQVKNTLRDSWHRLRGTVQSFSEIAEGNIQLGQLYALCQNHLLGLDTEQTSSLLADALGSQSEANIAGAAFGSNGIDDVEVPASQVLPNLEKKVKQQWENLQNALSKMPAKLSLTQVQKFLSTNGIKMTVGELCHVPTWTTLISNNMTSARSQNKLASSRQKNDNNDRIESILKSKINRTWKRMNVAFRKESKESRKSGKVDVRQLNSVLSKFGIQLAHDDLLFLFSKFDKQNIGL
jgi:hypothetical protein